LRQPSLSVVVPNYNHAALLEQTLPGILEQSFKPIEVIVVDDGSTDNSVEVIRELMRKDPAIRLIQNEKNQGIHFSVDRALKLARGDYIYFAAADDIVFPGFFENSMRLLTKYPQAGLCSAIRKVITADGIGYRSPLNIPAAIECYLSPQQCARLLRKYDSWMGGNSCVYRRDAVLESGGLRSDLSALCDIFLGMVVALKYGACFIPQQLTGFRMAPGGYSARFHLNIETSLEVYSKAVNLMRNEYSNLFPTDYVDSWSKRAIYLLRLNTLNKLFFHEVEIVKDIIPKKNFVDKILFCSMKIMSYGQLMFLMLYFFVRLDYNFRIVLWRNLLIKIRRRKERYRWCRRRNIA